MNDEMTFQQQFVPDGPPTLQSIFARALAPDAAELAEAKRAREDEEAREERRLNMAAVNRSMGDPLGNATRAQMAVAEARDRVADLEGQLEQARQVLHRAAAEYVDWQESAEMVTASARRSGDPDLLADAKRALANARVDQMLAARSQAPGRRPKGHGGHAVRSKVTCADCIKFGASAEESWMIHNDPDAPIEAEFVSLSEQALAAFGRETGIPYRPDQDRAQREGRARLTGHEIVRTTGNDAIVGIR